MKKILLLNIFAIICITATAQNYSQVGAIGHYNVRSTFAPGNLFNSYATLETVKDTFINNFPCKKLIETNYDFNGRIQGRAAHFIQNNGAQVFFFYKDSTSSWVRDTLYNFALTQGESYTFYQDIYQPVTVTIDSVSSMTINGVSRVVQHLRSSHVGIYLEDMAVEGLGALFFFMPWGDSDPRGGIRCYQDSTIGFYQNLAADTCDYIYVGLEDLQLNKSNVSIYPNPTNSNLNVEWLPNQQINHLQLIDVQGKVIQSINQDLNQSNSYQINLENVNNGIYFLKVFSEVGVVAKKLIKN